MRASCSFVVFLERVLVGYGLTETSPVIANRVACENTKGTTGKPVPGSEVKIADLESGQQVRRRQYSCPTMLYDCSKRTLYHTRSTMAVDIDEESSYHICQKLCSPTTLLFETQAQQYVIVIAWIAYSYIIGANMFR